MAFTGAPAEFPVSQNNLRLQRYLVWSNLINDQAEKFIRENIPSRPFLGIHMRHASDWVSMWRLWQACGQCYCSGFGIDIQNLVGTFVLFE